MENNKIDIVMKDIKEITRYHDNYKIHSPEQIANIISSVEEFDITLPILINSKGVIIAGDGRFQAFKKMGLTQIPVVIKDFETEEQEKAYRVIDNEIGAFGVTSNFDKKLEALKNFKMDPRILELANLKQMDFLYKSNPVKSLVDFSLHEKNLKEQMPDAFITPEQDTNDGDKAEPDSDSILNKEVIGNVCKEPKKYYLSLIIESEYKKPSLIQMIEERLSDLGAIVR